MDPLREKSYSLSLYVIALSEKLKENKDFVLADQLLKSGTSVGANLIEAKGAQSRKDFISKQYISYKELKESIYWLRLLYDSNKISREDFFKSTQIAFEIERMLAKSLKTSQFNQKLP